MKVYHIFKCIESNPKHEHAKYAKVLKGIFLDQKHRWTAKEIRIYHKALQKHGKNHSRIWKYLPNKTYEQVRARATRLLRSIRDDNSHQNSHLKGVLEKTHSRYWSKKEEATFAKLFKKYGKNYKLIKAAIPTKTLEQVEKQKFDLFLKIKRDPKHCHSALKK